VPLLASTTIRCDMVPPDGPVSRTAKASSSSTSSSPYGRCTSPGDTKYYPDSDISATVRSSSSLPRGAATDWLTNTAIVQATAM
jgi:hypothetical protein